MLKMLDFSAVLATCTNTPLNNKAKTFDANNEACVLGRKTIFFANFESQFNSHSNGDTIRAFANTQKDPKTPRYNTGRLIKGEPIKW